MAEKGKRTILARSLFKVGWLVGWFLWNINPFCYLMPNLVYSFI